VSDETPRGGLADRLKSDWELVALAVIVLVFLVIGFMWAVRHPPLAQSNNGDGRFYETMVKQLLTTGVYGYKSTTPNAYVTPGYPYFLAAVYAVTGYATKARGPYGLIHMLQLLMSAGSIVLTYLIGSELFGRRVGLGAAALIALFPPLYVQVFQLVTEPMAMVTFLGSIYALLLAKRRGAVWLWALAGGLFAVAILVRPGFLIAGIAGAAYALWTGEDRSRWLVHLGAAAVAFAVVVSPWVTRNVIQFHEPVLLSNHMGDPLLAGVDPYHWEKLAKYQYAGPTYFRYMELQSEAASGNAGAAISRDAFMRSAVIGLVRADPVGMVEWFTIGKLRSMYARIWMAQKGWILSLTWAVQFVLVGLGFGGVLLAIRDPRLRLLAAIILFGVATLLPFVPEPRFVYCYWPLLAVCAAAMMSAAWRGAGLAARSA
jgi:4-amino-4-deoxy-L-arabinose transferase-like glycosyltransferase